MKDSFGLKGTLNISKYNGNILIAEYQYENLITNVGLDYLLKLIGGDITTGGINKLAIGDGNKVATKSDTSLQNKLLLLDVQKDYSIANKINFLSIIKENTFSTIVNYKEAGLAHRTSNTEFLITRLIFDNVIYQKPENSLSLLYSLELKV